MAVRVSSSNMFTNSSNSTSVGFDAETGMVSPSA